jgi:hypothetical protein
LAQIFLCTCSKIKQFQFCETDGYKKGKTTKFFILFIVVVGSGMGKNQDPGSGKNIPDPQHCKNGRKKCQKMLYLSIFRKRSGKAKKKDNGFC